ncbi:hypothetical protein J3R83DRAFT_1355 [Lanmaoa asiatica]|nr:hypothetical protein J3R83DRAFT_1355 [Lanmaoa asiatica]
MANQICYEFTVVEVFAFLNFFCAFIYYDVIFFYAINAIRGQGIWTASVKDAATGTKSAVNPGIPMVQPQFNVAPITQYQNCDAYPSNVPLTQSYNAYPQQVPPQGSPVQPHNAYPQQLTPPPFLRARTSHTATPLLPALLSNRLTTLATLPVQPTAMPLSPRSPITTRTLPGPASASTTATVTIPVFMRFISDHPRLRIHPSLE